MTIKHYLTRYGQRWQDETVFSMVKRRLGSAVSATTYWSHCRALMLKAVTHNVLIMLCALRASETTLAAA